MKKWRSIYLLFFISGASLAQTEKIILDTDLDSDVDDVGAMAMLHTLEDQERVEILGVIVTSNDLFAPQCADAINHYFNRPDYSGWEIGNDIITGGTYLRKMP